MFLKFHYGNEENHFSAKPLKVDGQSMVYEYDANQILHNGYKQYQGESYFHKMNA